MCECDFADSELACWFFFCAEWRSLHKRLLRAGGVYMTSVVLDCGGVRLHTATAIVSTPDLDQKPILCKKSSRPSFTAYGTLRPSGIWTF